MTSRTARRWAGITALAGLMLAALVLGPRPADAHAAFERSVPAPGAVLAQAPDAVSVWFTEALTPGISTMRVVNAAGARVDAGEAAVDQANPRILRVGLRLLPDGGYTVSWKSLSAVDGHVVQGAFSFSVGAAAAPLPVASPEAPSGALGPVARWLSLLGMLSLVGGLVFEAFVLGPALVAAGVGAAGAEWRARLWRSVLPVLLALTAMALGAQLLQLAAQAREAGGGLGETARAVITTSTWGRLWLWRSGLVGVAVALLAASRWTEGAAGRWARAGALTCGVGALLTVSLTSHAAALPTERVGAIVADLVHLTAAACWAGGVVYLTAALPAIERMAGPLRKSIALAVVSRFSALALLSAGALGMSGAFAAYAQVTRPEALGTAYGFALSVKVGLALLLGSLGAVNLVWVAPRLARVDGAVRTLRWTVTGEAAVVVLLLLATGYLTSLEPARQAVGRALAQRPTVSTVQLAGARARVELTLADRTAGEQTLAVRFTDDRGEALGTVRAVNMRWTYTRGGIAPGTGSATLAGPGQFLVERAGLTVAGPWLVEVTAQRTDGFDLRAAWPVEMVAAGGGDATVVSPSARTARLLLAAVLVAVGAWGVALVLLGGRWWARPHVVVGYLGGGAAAVGLAVLFLAPAVARVPDASPEPATVASLAHGGALYAQHCQTCHGATGRGDGPVAAALAVRPADIVQHMAHHTDGELYAMVRDGTSAGVMPRFATVLGKQETWHLINYLRTLDAGAGVRPDAVPTVTPTALPPSPSPAAVAAPPPTQGPQLVAASTSTPAPPPAAAPTPAPPPPPVVPVAPAPTATAAVVAAGLPLMVVRSGATNGAWQDEGEFVMDGVRHRYGTALVLRAGRHALDYGACHLTRDGRVYSFVHWHSDPFTEVIARAGAGQAFVLEVPGVEMTVLAIYEPRDAPCG